jgi:hypothetical protein
MTVQVVGYELLEKLLNQRLDEMLVSLKRNDLIGKLQVKVVSRDKPFLSQKCRCERPSVIVAGKGPFCKDCDDMIQNCLCPPIGNKEGEHEK